ncbi:MAG TPA: 23S rRNA (guanosine(2251)-2'-O)-methyltransferase RlmB [Firmicutes bacterium]|uniref:23S rRNA (Guanosine(2251)-2'-O)-methyltransferase RlmB n=1 Tax=Capillibacterium thermochitinicola TaxID=2699427 RepID=A0A8J6HZU0_9FIRM|nr:23S rRNA (guanosine(2251)-2'-O)-methyltransferase RlmB [Capillibacterium thermochitinicola]MBA2132851.1 23S rRNA (guanosine(2251)-2'-O)-methyltransferase RlmB [Capillibacterium thermochitinicola]HHW13123.1 23S rRNA (guanosine(2251)-2'-O)-methyltransferase RlmB [Bacillota bacterium]
MAAQERGEWLEGRNPVWEALQAGRKLKKVYIAKQAHGPQVSAIVALVQERGIPLEYCERKELDRLATTGRHQGVMALAEPLTTVTVDNLLAQARARGENPLLVLLDGVEDPHNVGSIIRTVEVGGGHGVILPERRSAGLNATVLKASAGAANHLPVAVVKNTVRGIEELKAKGCWVIGADQAGDNLWTSTFDLTLPLCLVLGSEGRGLSRLAKEKCDLLLRIPMQGRVSSLNVSVAAGILLYEVLRRRRPHDIQEKD